MSEKQLEMVICGLASLENILCKERYNDELNSDDEAYRVHNGLLSMVHYLQDYVKREIL